MKKGTLLFLLVFALLYSSFAQTNQNPTTLYEWNQNGSVNTGERIVATINSGTIGTYTAISIVGQIIDGTSNWGYSMPIVANFKLFINFSSSVYGLQQDVVTPNLTLELKSISATQVVIVANCPNGYKQARILLRYTNGTSPTLTLGDPQVITTAGTPLISHPTYSNELAGRLAINVTNNTKAAAYTLAVGGKAIAEAVTVQLQGAWPDYVFKKDYQMPSLTDVKTYIDQNQHLPDMPSEAEVAKGGLNLGEMNKLLVKKVEELTLYLIEKDKKDQEQSKITETLEIRLKQQQEQIDELKAQMKSSLKH